MLLAAVFTSVLAPESVAYLTSFQDIPAMFGDTLRFLVSILASSFATRIRTRMIRGFTQRGLQEIGFLKDATPVTLAIVMRDTSLSPGLDPNIHSLLDNLREIPPRIMPASRAAWIIIFMTVARRWFRGVNYIPNNLLSFSSSLVKFVQ